ncbi:MAG: clostripain-related cysteine peptidase [Fimbriimonadaceae bacterium]
MKSFSWFRAGVFFLVSVGLGVMFGCGGGGGGGSTGSTGRAPGSCLVTTALGNINYSTIWGNSPTNASQVIQIIDADGFTIRSDSVNRSGAVSSFLPISNVSAGIHLLKATVYAAANASGTVLGESSQVVDLCSAAPASATVAVSTQFGLSASELSFIPNPVSVEKETIIPFVATPMNGNQAVFVPVGDLSWSVSGSIGTILSSVGQFTATTVGNGTVTVSSASTSLSKVVPVTVTPRVTQQSKWTVLVYLNAANDLYSYSTLNVNQMEQVASNSDVRFVVQWKQSKSDFGGSTFDGVRRYLVKPDNTSAIVSDVVQNNLRDSNGNALDMGSTDTLRDFIAWGKANYPADRYCIILWNHGNGWKRSIDDQPTRAFSYDDQYGTSIKSWETDAAFVGQHFDILAWDASLMQMMEVAYEVRNHADYVVGSEESPPGEGYPYHLIFDNFRDNPNAPTDVLASAFVQGMQEQAQPGGIYEFRNITQSVLESAKLDAVVTAISTLADDMSANNLLIAAQIQSIRNSAQSYSPGPSRVYRDLYDICLRLEADGTIPGSIQTKAAAVRTAINDAVKYEYHNTRSANSHGISIDFSSNGSYAAYRSDYIRMKFANDSTWDQWLEVAP